jgi:hypothetical protein
MDDDGDLHEQILHIETQIEDLTDVIARCQKISLISKAAMAAGTLILAIIIGAVGFDPAVMNWGDCGCYRRDGSYLGQTRVL